MFHGHWTCADCGKEITELPFEPSPDRPVFAKNAGQREGLRGKDKGFVPGEIPGFFIIKDGISFIFEFGKERIERKDRLSF